MSDKPSEMRSQIEVLQAEIRDLELKNSSLRAEMESARREADEAEHIHSLFDDKLRLQRENWLMQRGYPPDADICTPYDGERECHNDHYKIHNPPFPPEDA